MPRHLTSDAHEWINEIPTVTIYYLAKPQPRERAWRNHDIFLLFLYFAIITCLTNFPLKLMPEGMLSFSPKWQKHFSSYVCLAFFVSNFLR